MERPQSIVWFERCYLGAVVLGLASTVLNWSQMQEQLEATPNSALLPSWFMPATIGIGILISLLLWFFVARRGSVVAKWIVTVFFVIGLIGLPTVIGGMSSGLIAPAMAIVSLINFVLNGIAVWMLFRSDSKPWFAGKASGQGNLTDTFS